MRAQFIFVSVLLSGVFMAGVSMAEETVLSRRDFNDLHCDVRVRYTGTRTGRCSFDDVVTAVTSVGSGTIQVECGRLEVTCPNPVEEASTRDSSR